MKGTLPARKNINYSSFSLLGDFKAFFLKIAIFEIFFKFNQCAL